MGISDKKKEIICINEGCERVLGYANRSGYCQIHSLYHNKCLHEGCNIIVDTTARTGCCILHWRFHKGIKKGMTSLQAEQHGGSFVDELEKQHTKRIDDIGQGQLPRGFNGGYGETKKIE